MCMYIFRYMFMSIILGRSSLHVKCYAQTTQISCYYPYLMCWVVQVVMRVVAQVVKGVL